MGRNLNISSDNSIDICDKSEWGTPQKFFDYCNYKYGDFTLDAAASSINAKCERFFTKCDDALNKDWNGIVWLNPPYGRNTTGLFVKKALDEVSIGHANRVVCLLPAATDTRWFHNYCVRGLNIFIRGRLTFEGAEDPAPFPSMLTIFDNNIRHLEYLNTLYSTTIHWR